MRTTGIRGEARAASAYEHWVGFEGLGFRGRDDASGSATLVKLHWRSGRRGRRGVRSRAQPPRPRRGRPDRARLHVRRRLEMGAALLAEREGSVGDDRLDACLRVDASVSPTSCRCPHRSKCGSLRGARPRSCNSTRSKSPKRATPGHDLSARRPRRSFAASPSGHQPAGTSARVNRAPQRPSAQSTARGLPLGTPPG